MSAAVDRWSAVREELCFRETLFSGDSVFIDPEWVEFILLKPGNSWPDITKEQMMNSINSARSQGTTDSGPLIGAYEEKIVMLFASDCLDDGGLSVDKIVLDDINTADYLSIRTANSAYTFSIVNPAQRLGALMGGAVGRHPLDALLLGAKTDHSKLTIGSQALFYLMSAKGLKPLITSAITGLIHLKSRSSDQRFRER